MANRNEDTLATRKAFIQCWVHANPETTRKGASALYDRLEKDYPEITRGGHRGLVGRQKPWEHIKHECPCCGFEVKGVTAVVEEFGLRNMGDKKYFQSNCPTCKNLTPAERDEIRDRRGKEKYERVNPNTASEFTNEPCIGQKNPAYSEDK